MTTQQKDVMFHSSVYARISHSLSREAKVFWDTLMLEQVDVPDDYIDQFDQNKLSRQLKRIASKAANISFLFSVFISFHLFLNKIYRPYFLYL